jgi:hypothetical protein
MKKIAFVSSLMLICTTGFSQTQMSGPSTTVSFKKNPTSTELRNRVLQLSEYDEDLTERVIIEIKKEKILREIQILSEESFAVLEEKERSNAITEYQIIQFISQLKSQK